MRPRTGIAAFMTVLSAHDGRPAEVGLTDQLGATALPPQESFRGVVPALNDQVVRGVSVTPGTR